MAKKDQKLDQSTQSMIEATRSRAKFSGHGNAKGAAGYRDPDDNDYAGSCEFLTATGNSIAINPQEGGYDPIKISVAWDNVHVQESGFIGKLFKKVRKVGVDMDIGCLYEMKDGTRGAIQAFGKKFGDFENVPFIKLSGDERTGCAEGEDEYILINGQKWNEIEKILIYLYIYDGAGDFEDVKPQVIVDIPGENDLVVVLGANDDVLDLCAVAELHNVRGGIKLTNQTEYFPGHESMDRAYGYGLDWADGQKSA